MGHGSIRAMQVPECDVFVMVGEASGDAYGAQVVEALRQARPELEFAAAGCGALRKAGVDIDVSMDDYGVMGFVAVFKRLGEFRALGKRVESALRARRPKLVISIDYPGFNLRMIKQLQDLRRSGTRFLHVVAPQVWAWKPRRAKKVARLVDELACFFPFEPPLFQRHGGRATFVGHPLADRFAKPPAVETVERELGLAPDDRLLLLAPGSRAAEVGHLLPVFDEAVARVAHRLTAPGRLVVAVAKAPELDHGLYRRLTHHPLVEGRYHELAARAHLGIISSGTATLEAALLGLPHVICYRGDHLSATLARHLIRTPHVGLPNIIHGRRILPELMQGECEPLRMAAHVQRLWAGGHRDRACAALAQTGQRLGKGGAMQRIAGLAEGLLSQV